MKANFNGLRVLALESRYAKEIAKLIEATGGTPTVAPAMREVPLQQNPQALSFAAALLHGEFEMVIFLTGVGARALLAVVEVQYSKEAFLRALRRVAVVARGPKPMAVLREWQVPVALCAREPNTWRELLLTLDEAQMLSGLRVAVQEYGISNHEFLAALRERGAIVTSVPVYQWALPEDLDALQAAVTAIASETLDVALFTTRMQVDHLLQVARQMHLEDGLRRGLGRMVIASIGPTTSEGLRQVGIQPDFEPSHPKMGLLVQEAAENSAELFLKKHHRPLSTS